MRPLSDLAPAGFTAGLLAPFQGTGFVLKRPKLWLLALVPILITLALSATFASLALLYIPDKLTHLLGTPSAWYAKFGVRFATFLVTTGAVLLGLLLSLSLAPPLSGPALDRLLRAFRQELGVPCPSPLPWWTELRLAIGASCIGLAVALPTLAVLLLVELLVPAAAVVTVPAKLLVAGELLVWNFMDYPFTLQGLASKKRFAWLKSQWRANLGFALSLSVVFLIPCMGLLMLPGAAVGAAWLLTRCAEPHADTTG